jgi:hypothetical protein
VILVAAGNNIDFYQYMNFARQYCRCDVIDVADDGDETTFFLIILFTSLLILTDCFIDC